MRRWGDFSSVRILSGSSIDCVGRLLARATNCFFPIILSQRSNNCTACVVLNEWFLCWLPYRLRAAPSLHITLIPYGNLLVASKRWSDPTRNRREGAIVDWDLTRHLYSRIQSANERGTGQRDPVHPKCVACQARSKPNDCLSLQLPFFLSDQSRATPTS